MPDDFLSSQLQISFIHKRQINHSNLWKHQKKVAEFKYISTWNEKLG